MGFDTYESSKEGSKNILRYENEYEDFNTGLQCIYIVPMYNKFMKKDFPEGFRNIPDRIKLYEYSELYEYSDSLYLPNGTSKVSFLEETAYPFLYFTNMEDKDKLFVGKGGSTHGSIVRKIVDIYGSDDYSDSLIRCKGRIFTNEKVLTLRLMGRIII